MTTNWALVHDYRRAVESGKVAPIVCLKCEGATFPIIDRKRDDEPALECFECGSVLHLGGSAFEKIKKALNEA